MRAAGQQSEHSGVQICEIVLSLVWYTGYCRTDAQPAAWRPPFQECPNRVADLLRLTTRSHLTTTAIHITNFRMEPR